ncbi:MAG: undecaprenyl-diphosphatase UppP [Acidobacteriia bacterium]|nr:undecaprenyl-diphosphatase UppP [Terriglobia bacterium]
MELFAAAVLGIIQGLTEFLPISSSAHLILVPWILGWKPEGLMFDVSLHLGTAVAILGYFWKDWVTLARETICGIHARAPFGNAQRRLAWFLIVGTLPAALVGLLFEKSVEETLRSPLVTVATLVVLGIVLFIADRRSRRQRSLETFTWGDAIWIGSSQALALIPGVSRSGITISTAMLRDADRTSAARFSFLLATPIIVGAGMLEGWHLIKVVRGSALTVSGIPASPLEVKWSVLAMGVSCAAITGFLCIRYFLRYLQSGSFIPFVVYRFILAAVVLLFYFQYL